MSNYRLDLFGWGWGPLPGCCEYGNEPSVFTEVRGLFAQQNVCHHLYKDSDQWNWFYRMSCCTHLSNNGVILVPFLHTPDPAYRQDCPLQALRSRHLQARITSFTSLRTVCSLIVIYVSIKTPPTVSWTFVCEKNCVPSREICSWWPYFCIRFFSLLVLTGHRKISHIHSMSSWHILYGHSPFTKWNIKAFKNEIHSIIHKKN